MRNNKVLICYLTYSGNTEEVAQLIEKTLTEKEMEVEMYDIYTNDFNYSFNDYDYVLLGAFTWDQGYVPDEMVDFVYQNCKGLKGDKVHVFGTGDTQFGGMEIYCIAADKIAKYFNSPHPTLKIEQSPRGSQEELVRTWAEKI